MNRYPNRWFDDELPWPDDEDEAPYRAPLAMLTSRQQADLAATIERHIQAKGCDNTLQAAEGWARLAGIRWPQLRRELRSRGGYCDCEVLFNVGLTEETG